MGSLLRYLERIAKCIHIYNLTCEPGFFHGKGHQVAFHGPGNGTTGIYAVGFQNGSKVFHNAVITAAVAATIGADVDGSLVEGFCLIGNMTANDNLLGAAICFNFTVFAHDVDLSEAGTGLGSEGECCRNAIFKFHGNAHVVTDVVVAVIDASAVGAGFQGLQ